jgi:hypothetical protein
LRDFSEPPLVPENSFLTMEVMSHARLVSDVRERDTSFDRENVKRLIDSLPWTRRPRETCSVTLDEE